MLTEVLPDLREQRLEAFGVFPLASADQQFQSRLQFFGGERSARRIAVAECVRLVECLFLVPGGDRDCKRLFRQLRVEAFERAARRGKRRQRAEVECGAAARECPAVVEDAAPAASELEFTQRRVVNEIVGLRQPVPQVRVLCEV